MNKPSNFRLLSCMVFAFQLSASSTAFCAEAPVNVARYQGKLFELIEPDEGKYDAAFAKRFASMLEPYAKGHRNFRKRITSGAATESTTLKSGGHTYLECGTCQAHQCDTTTMDVLFDPVA